MPSRQISNILRGLDEKDNRQRKDQTKKRYLFYTTTRLNKIKRLHY